MFIYFQPSFVKVSILPLSFAFTTAATAKLTHISNSHHQDIFSVFSCRLISGEYYISANVAMKCYTAQFYHYLYFFMLPLLLMWVILIPGLVYHRIRKAAFQKRLQTFAVQYKYGFLYREYKVDVYWWEFIKIYQKVGITMIILVIGPLQPSWFAPDPAGFGASQPALSDQGEVGSIHWITPLLLALYTLHSGLLLLCRFARSKPAKLIH